MSATTRTRWAGPAQTRDAPAGGGGGDRCLVLWFPGWPVTAWAPSEGADAHQPLAVVVANRVVACSAEASGEGVAIGQRRREAQSRCPTLRVLPADEARDNREFAAVVDCIEQLVPGVEVVRPGVCALRSRGFAGYVGSEAEAAEVLLETVVTTLGITSGRAGVADGLFAALQAAYAGDPVRIVASGDSAAFLAPLPVGRLGDATLTTLLPRLGVQTLGDFAALDPDRGARAVRRARASGCTRWRPAATPGRCSRASRRPSCTARWRSSRRSRSPTRSRSACASPRRSSSPASARRRSSAPSCGSS